MGTLGVFLLKSILVSGLLTIWYLLGLRGRRLHHYNRLFLLSALFASFTIPLFHFRLFSIPHSATGTLAPVALFVQSAGDAVSNIPPAQQPLQTQFNWQLVAGLIAMTVSLALLAILCLRILKLRRMSKQYPVTQQQGINLILTDSQSAPFTFLKNLFWNRSIPLEGEIGQLIFRHELAHIQEGHTYDKLACQALTCLFWFNPFYWIIQKELNMVHEFIADEHAVSNRDTEAFAMMMLQSYNNGNYLVPQHHFFSSAVKRRLAMLQNAAKPSYAVLRRFMILPIIAGAILIFSCRTTNEVAGITPSKKKIIVLVDAAHGGIDAGAQSGSYSEKEICLKYATRLKELAPAYNIEVRLTRNDDKYVVLSQRVAMSDNINPDLLLSLHIGDKPGNDKAKGDFNIYVPGENANARKSNDYSSAIFQYMAQDGIIPGIANKCNHAPGVVCNNCKNAVLQAAAQQAENAKIMATEENRFYLLKHARGNVLMMVLGNIKNNEGMQQLTDDNRMEILCNAILKGIVDGATEKTGTRQACAPYVANPAPEGPVSFNNFKVTLPN